MPNRLQTLDTDGLAERGVYLHPYLGANGERYVVAVDRSGRRVMEATLCRGRRDVDLVVDLLWQFLDNTDPTHLVLLT